MQVAEHALLPQFTCADWQLYEELPHATEHGPEGEQLSVRLLHVYVVPISQSTTQL